MSKRNSGVVNGCAKVKLESGEEGFLLPGMAEDNLPVFISEDLAKTFGGAKQLRRHLGNVEYDVGDNPYMHDIRLGGSTVKTCITKVLKSTSPKKGLLKVMAPPSTTPRKSTGTSESKSPPQAELRA